MTDGERNFWIYALGIVISLPITVFRLLKSKDTVTSPLKFGLYTLSSWIGIADAIIDSAIWYYKSKRKEIRDKKISE